MDNFLSRLLRSSPAGQSSIRVIMTILIMIVAMAWVVPQAGAISYSTASQGSCQSPLAVGDSWLNWSGGFPLDWGKSWGYLYLWQNSAWTLKSSSYGSASGSSNNAQASDATGAGGSGLSWWQTGTHQASFFSGTKYSSGNVFTCL